MEACNCGAKNKPTGPDSSLSPDSLDNLSTITVVDAELATFICILVGRFYLVTVDCFFLRKKGQGPDGPGVLAGT